jgi:hypothetical protein
MPRIPANAGQLNRQNPLFFPQLQRADDRRVVVDRRLGDPKNCDIYPLLEVVRQTKDTDLGRRQPSWDLHRRCPSRPVALTDGLRARAAVLGTSSGALQREQGKPAPIRLAGDRGSGWVEGAQGAIMRRRGTPPGLEPDPYLDHFSCLRGDRCDAPTVGYAEPDGHGQLPIWLEAAVVNRLRLPRGSGDRAKLGDGHVGLP